MYSFLITFVSYFFMALRIALFARIILSWIDPMGNMRISQIARDLTEPILAPIRSVLPNFGMLDLSPLVAFFLIEIVGNLIVRALI